MHYFYDVPINLAYRDVDLFQTLPATWPRTRRSTTSCAVRGRRHSPAPGSPTPSPASYDFTQTLEVPRDVLPATGDLRAWFPLPIEVGPQTDVRISELTPST